jgi:hypothetical protein
MRKNYIYKKDNYNVTKFNLIASDVENNPDTGEFICAGLYGKVNGKVIEKYFTDIREYNNNILALDNEENKIVFYNLSYDEAFLRDIVDDSRILRNQSRVIKISLANCDIIDIQNISGIEYSLEKWIEYLNLKEKGITKVDFSDIKLRVMNDTKATWYLADFIQNYLNDTWKISLKDTIGSCALEIFKCNFLKQNIVRELPDDEIPNFERECLRGGRCEVFIRGIVDVISYDVRSMYVSIMRDCKVPIPDKFNYLKDEKELKHFRKYMNKYLSILDATVYIPKQKIAPLPCYCKVNGVEKVIYPYGTFRGVWTNIELQEAEKSGAIILKCHRMIYYYKSDYLFRDFALKVWNMREKHNRKCKYNCSKCYYEDVTKCNYSVRNPDFNKALDTMTKKIGNSLFGKFSQHIPEISYYGRESQLPESFKPYLKQQDKFFVGMYEYNDEVYIDIHSKDKIDSKFCFTVISAFITSYARIKLLRAMKKVEKYVVYCDTDSIKIINKEGAYVDNGKNLGDFMAEYAKKERFFAPKFYGSKTKGISKNERRIIEENEKDGYIIFEFKKPYKFRSAIRQKKALASWEKIIKQVDLYDDKRVWYGEMFYGYGVESSPYELTSGHSMPISVNT